jgi:hypothetical protein
MDKYLSICNEVSTFLRDLKKIENDYNPDDVLATAIKIVEIILKGNVNIGDIKYTDAYLKHLIKNKRLCSRSTGVRGGTPAGVCCAIFGVWSAVPLLINKRLIGKEKDQIKLSMLINFCWDLLDEILPDGIDGLKKLKITAIK